MSEIFDTTTIITIAVAVFILLRLRSVLGTRSGHERPPFEPYEIDRKTKQPRPANSNVDEESDNVVPMPGRGPVKEEAKRVASKTVSASDEAINAYAKSGTKLNDVATQFLFIARSNKNVMTEYTITFKIGF